MTGSELAGFGSDRDLTGASDVGIGGNGVGPGVLGDRRGPFWSIDRGDERRVDVRVLVAVQTDFDDHQTLHVSSGFWLAPQETHMI